MNYLALIGGIVGLIAYCLLILALLRSNVQQSFAAFLLWAMLDIIATVTTMLQGGNYWLALSNAIGSSVITLILISKKQVSWSWIETMTASLVVICLTVWSLSGERAGIIASSLAIVLASIPQMVDTFKKPESTPTLAYGVFTIANVISLLGGRAWTFEERVYQCCSILFCVVIVAFSLKKRVA